MEQYGITWIGNVRQQNQDVFACGNAGQDVYALVCDGMGGPNGGGLAAEIAAETMTKALEDDAAAQLPAEALRGYLEQIASSANHAVFRQAMADAELAGMGTTMVLCLVREEKAYILHAGDSRLYVFSNDELQQVTKDHSMVQTLVDQGELTPEEARVHPERNLITNALGIRPDFGCDYTLLNLQKGDKLLLCSDGVTNELTDDQIAAMLSKQGSAKQLAEDLMEAVKQTEAKDNATLVVALI